MSYSGDDTYCNVIIPGKEKIQVVHESSRALAYHQTNPKWSTHIVVVPKKHIPSLIELETFQLTAIETLRMVTQVAKEITQEKGGCSVLTNLGSYQDSKHLAFHIYNDD